MKQQLSSEQLESMYSDYQELLATELKCNPSELLNCISIGSLMAIIRQSHQMDIYTVDSSWCIHLFEPNVASNDIGISCIYEICSTELIYTLFTALIWVYDNIRESRN
jgi:hypothetical protein